MEKWHIIPKVNYEKMAHYSKRSTKANGQKEEHKKVNKHTQACSRQRSTKVMVKKRHASN